MRARVLSMLALTLLVLPVVVYAMCEQEVFKSTYEASLGKSLYSEFDVKVPLDELGTTLSVRGVVKGAPLNDTHWRVTVSSLTISNEGGKPVRIGFTEPLADLALYAASGEELYRWSRGRVFIALYRHADLAPGEGYIRGDVLACTIPWDALDGADHLEVQVAFDVNATVKVLAVAEIVLKRGGGTPSTPTSTTGTTPTGKATSTPTPVEGITPSTPSEPQDAGGLRLQLALIAFAVSAILGAALGALVVLSRI